MFASGAGVTREEIYGFVMGLSQGRGGGRGKGVNGREYFQDLDERQFRRVDKFKGDKELYKGWMYEVLTGIGVINSKLQLEIEELMKKYREEELEYKDFDMEEEINRERYEYYKGQLYGVLVALTERGGESRMIVKGLRIAEKSWMVFERFWLYRSVLTSRRRRQYSKLFWKWSNPRESKETRRWWRGS